jgi:hypothetical protein
LSTSSLAGPTTAQVLPLSFRRSRVQGQMGRLSPLTVHVGAPNPFIIHPATHLAVRPSVRWTKKAIGISSTEDLIICSLEIGLQFALDQRCF